MAVLLWSTELSSQPIDQARIHAWKADLHTFAMRLITEHPAPFRQISREAFEARLQVLDQSIGRLNDQEIAAQWSTLIATLGDEHTEVDFEKELGAWRLPVVIKVFADGPYIVKATLPYRHLLGARLERVDQDGLDHIQQVLKGYVAHHQEGWYRTWFEDSFDSRPLLMEAAGLVKVKASWSVGGTLGSGDPFSESISLLASEDSDRQRWVDEATPQGAPLRDQEPRRSYFYRVLRKDRTLYLRFRLCEEDPGRPFDAFLGRAVARVRSDHLTRLVVDLRGNAGGQESMVDHLLRAIRVRTTLRGPQGLMVLTDGGVFSSGAVAAWRLKHQMAATLFGEPCGAAVNHVGAVFDVALPSGRVARWGTEIHVIDRDHPEDFTSPITPDVPVSMRHADVALGRDPVLEAALHHWVAPMPRSPIEGVTSTLPMEKNMEHALASAHPTHMKREE